MVEIPSHLKDKLEELQYFEDVMNEASMTPEERARYEISLEAYREEMNVMSFYTRKGKEEGLAEGRAKGLAEGKAEGRAEGLAEGKAEGQTEAMLSTIRKLLAKGMSQQEIIDLLDIDPKFFSMV